MRKASATISPLSCFTSSMVPATVPPVARRSSTMSTFAPGLSASRCISSVAEPYSRSYSTLTTSAGSLPSLRTGTKPTPRLYAIGAPKMNPRDSMPTTTSMSRLPMRSMSPSIAALKDSPSFNSVVMSLNRMPGLGKSGMSRMRVARSFVVTATGESLLRRGAQRTRQADERNEAARLEHVRVGEQSLDAMGHAIGRHNAHVRVGRGSAIEDRQDAEEVAHQNPCDTAVSDEQHGLAGVLRRDAADRAQRALDDRLQRLAAGPRDEPVVTPIRQAPRFVERRAGAVADIDLHEIGFEVDRELVPAGDGDRGVAAARERARDDPVNVDLGKLVRDRLRLAPAALGQRAVAATGEAPRGVRLALAVPHEIDRDRRAHAGMRRSATFDHPRTRVMSGCSTSRFHGWSNSRTRIPASASVFEMITSSSQKRSRRSSFARRVLY